MLISRRYFCTVLLLLISVAAIAQSAFRFKTDSDLTVGAACFDNYLPLLQGKSVALVANPTSQINGVHLVDTLLRLGVQRRLVFAPEHGFRGEAGAGEKVSGGIDSKSGVRVVSLYGKKKKPEAADLKGIDIVLFDIQDVGVRFYTYISTLQYVMESCADRGKPLIVLDRPNPNGHYVDGPVLEDAYRSFVGMNPIPVVHGCTVGEYARLLVGEHWLRTRRRLDLTVIPVKDYTHKDLYQLPVRPSPNLPVMNSIYAYPALCFFEGTSVSVGRGTSFPFEVYGAPYFLKDTFRFTPKSVKGVALHPPYQDTLCRGVDLRGNYQAPLNVPTKLELSWLMDAVQEAKDQPTFFIPFFNSLAGTAMLRRQLEAGSPESTIRASWQEALDAYKKLRKKYLMYTDFD